MAVFPGKYNVELDERGFARWVDNVETGDEPIEIVLVPTRLVRFLVEDEAGAAIRVLPWPAEGALDLGTIVARKTKEGASSR
jgi:hypothetical protein